MIPLILRLKKGAHKDVAIAQDLIMQEATGIFNEGVLHGGTAIWRCYNGNRFSEDIDMYIKKDLERINLFFKNLERSGFAISKKKIGDNSIYSELIWNRTSVRFEAIFKKANGSLKEYETAEGTYLTVYTLTPAELIIEKIDAYVKRLKVRDLYDIFFLLRYVEDINKIKNNLRILIKEFKKPIDEKTLKILIIEGLTPATDKMKDYIRQSI